MRDLKFRAWYKPNQKMYEVLTLDIIDEKALIENNDNPERSLRGYAKITEIELMQYTGLKDKNGVEIYEGDIVEYTASMFGVTEYKKTGKVEFYDSTYMLNDGQNSREWLDKENVNEWKIEVIGNIYKNPEWLEAE